jgi:hypothetical protein
MSQSTQHFVAAQKKRVLWLPRRSTLHIALSAYCANRIKPRLPKPVMPAIFKLCSAKSG